MCDQVEYHPYLDQTKVREACARHGMALVAYSPVAKGRIKNDQTLARIGRTLPQDRRADLPALAGAAECFRDPADLPDRTALGKYRHLRLRTVGRGDAADFGDGKRQRPAHRFRLRAEMGLRQWPPCRVDWRGRGPQKIRSIAMNLRQVIPRRHDGVGRGASVRAGAGRVVLQGAPVRRGDGGADRGRHRHGAGDREQARAGRSAKADDRSVTLRRNQLRTPPRRDHSQRPRSQRRPRNRPRWLLHGRIGRRPLPRRRPPMFHRSPIFRSSITCCSGCLRTSRWPRLRPRHPRATDRATISMRRPTRPPTSPPASLRNSVAT